jgi:hypothetical protein
MGYYIVLLSVPPCWARVLLNQKLICTFDGEGLYINRKDGVRYVGL